MTDLIVIDHSFIQPVQRKRWRLLAEHHPVNVTLIVPEIWRTDWFGKDVEFRPDRTQSDNYSVLPLPTTSNRDWMKYVYLSHDMGLRSIDPDMVHVQYASMALVHHQAILYKKLWGSDTKYTFFTMNALGVPREKLHQRLRWRHLKSNTDAALGHYPGCKESIRDAGFEKPIYLQTSYGVDEEIFCPDPEDRSTVRERLSFDDRFVIGYVGRLTEEKGVDTLLEALPLDNVDWSLLLVGDGEMREEIEHTVAQNDWENRVELTGYVPQEEVPTYLRAMDCFVLGSKTTPDWIDTFPRSIVQAMACEVPVIGSDSGAIPFQVGDAGLIYPEGEVVDLQERILRLARNEDLRDVLGKRGRRESVSRFGQRPLADNFYEIMTQVISGHIKYNNGSDRVQFKAY